MFYNTIVNDVFYVLEHNLEINMHGYNSFVFVSPPQIYLIFGSYFTDLILSQTVSHLKDISL